METASHDVVKSRELYTRQSTGLVREISLGSSIALNVAFVSIALAVLVATQEPFLFPGGSPLATILIGGGMCAFTALMYALLTAVMPRTGGEYIFVGRTIHPWLGFATNFNMVTWYLLGGAAFLAYLTAAFGLSAAFATMGVVIKSPTLSRWAVDISSHNWTFAIGAVVIVLAIVAVSLPMRWVMWIVKVIFALSIIGVLFSIVLLAIHGRGDFEAAVAKYGGNYGTVISDAQKAGYGATSSFSLSNTFLAIPLVMPSLLYAFMTSYVGGEIRSPKRIGVRGILYALVISVAVCALMFGLAARTFGDSFLGSATYLFNTGSHGYPFAGPAFFFFFVGMLTSSPFLVTVIALSFVAAFIAPIPAVFLATSRSIFAWSFDRVVPAKLSSVNRRTHTPLLANAIAAAVALGYLAVIVYGPAFALTLLTTALLAQLGSFVFVATASIALPYRRPDLYKNSPVRYLGRLPVLVLIGACALAVYGFAYYVLATRESLAATPNSGLIALGIVGALAVLIWPTSYLINRTRGIDLNAAVRELPPE
jgi:amino acid transporter